MVWSAIYDGRRSEKLELVQTSLLGRFYPDNSENCVFKSTHFTSSKCFRYSSSDWIFFIDVIQFLSNSTRIMKNLLIQFPHLRKKRVGSFPHKIGLSKSTFHKSSQTYEAWCKYVIFLLRHLLMWYVNSIRTKTLRILCILSMSEDVSYAKRDVI